MLDVDAARAAEAVPGRIAVTGCALPASPCDHRPMDRRRVVVSVVFYCGLTTVWLSILLDLFHRVLPSEIATRIGYNSEGVVLALVLGAWIQFVRPRLVGTLVIGLLLVASLVLVIGESWAGQGFPKEDRGVNWWTHTIPAWRSGDIARNLGMLLGLRGTGSLLPLAIFFGGLWTAVLLLLRTQHPSRRTTTAP